MARMTTATLDSRRRECKDEIQAFLDKKWKVQDEESARVVADALSAILEETRRKVREYIAAAKK
jgi:hypothetical protein